MFGRAALRLLSAVALIVLLAGVLAPNVSAGSGPHTQPFPVQSANSPSQADHGDSSGTDITPRFSAGEEIPCTSLTPKPGRFKDTGVTTCIEYATRILNGASFKVYYPVQWKGFEGWGTKYVEPSMESLEKSVSIYSDLGVMHDVNVVFSPENLDNGINYANAEVDGSGSADSCLVLIFVPAKALSVTSFRQILAHEVFHCFQYWNFRPQMDGSGAARKWWVEGTAEYFSNVVYPEVNFEWDRVKKFDNESPTKALTSMSYANAVFFQYLGNTIGDAAIIDLLTSLPSSGGEAEQQAALRAYPNFAKLFQDFAEQYLDKTIADTGGGMLPVNPKITPLKSPIAESTTIKLQPEPFVVFRYAPEFAPQKAFSLVFTFPEGVTRTGARLANKTGAWDRHLPEAIDCTADRTFLVALTNVQAGAAEATVTYDVSLSDSPCDKLDAGANDSCLVGAWAVIDFEGYIMSAYAASNPAAEITYEGQTGSLSYLFGSNEVTVVTNDFAIELSAEIAGSLASIEIHLEGTTTAPYTTAGDSTGNAELVPSEITVTLQVFLDGDEVYSDELPEFLRLIGGPFTYDCDGDSLFLTVNGPNGTPLPPMELTRQA